MMGKKFNLVYDGETKFPNTLCEVCGGKTLPSAMICNDCFNVLKELILQKKNKNMEINKQELFKFYMAWVDQVSEDCDWKTHFTPDEIVYKIADILEKNPQLIKNDTTGGV